MGAVTYPNPEVAEFISSHFIPLKLDGTSQMKQFKEFDVQWTPTFIICDRNRKEHHRVTGFLEPARFLGEMHLALANLAFHGEQYGEAAQAYRQVVERYPETSAAPAAVYYGGVCRYKDSGDPACLKEAFVELEEKYPGSDWAKKAEVWGD
jgi:hypothetical protein